MYKAVVALCLMLFAFGCASSTPDSEIEAKDDIEACAKRMRVLTAFPDSGTYVEINIVTDSDLAGDMEDLVNGLKVKACEIDADAIVVPGLLEQTGYKRSLSASAIRYTT